ncbi:precorrin-2 dehydrogenase/sirohydrochlorin ferrochelatase family protein [Paenibacillus tarimensis]|uniref:precorrin-2 dehydrogenase/sirohydrochlorin ferrochelatase family protein n=1 Tax=Paenibacillus tarimensis TaxID=416012 RepID=UPI001F483321|nr:bifunctional precorrin-2 dehydrogenase/sirohydrochlorin ferrochelatase [Paenibacillus tarimensis]MCF2943935.1 bifunctional precorrin-2 dehydrogenase/sirohydrochlorin ferrochelatase [Paenibacillus tarimensis]
MVRYYPIMLRLEGIRCIVIGGGPVAERKVHGLLEAGAEVVVVSPALTDGLEKLAAGGFIHCCKREYREQDLDYAALVFAAAGDRAVNREVAEAAKRRAIPCTVADKPLEGDFVTPSVVRRGDLVISVTASGNSPALAAHIARELEERYGSEYEDFTAWLGRLRVMAAAELKDSGLRHAVLRRAVHMMGDDWRMDIDEERIRERLYRIKRQLEGGMDDDEHCCR